MAGRETVTSGRGGPGADAGDLSPVKKALVEIRRLNRELARERGQRRQPIALVGMGMRFPGGVSRTEDLARLLQDGRDAVGALPRDRWAHDRYFQAGGPTPGKYYVDRGGFLGGVDLFDPEFFGIAPLEATTLDPQQRLLLETAWEALEDAAVPAASLRGSRTGVFLGIGTTDYHRAVLADADAIDTYASTGTAFSVASGRISYLMDLRGPAISVDTACSSSLVAVHLACGSLRSGESDLALAGGVSLMLSPEITINFCQAGMLSPDGRCKTFDAAADGYVRSEGCGVVVLKRLDDAVRDGDRVLAVLRGSAVNQDGRSSGLTAPNGPAQEAVLRAALTDAGLTPDDIGYVEAHGTGTPLGDPIEVQALGAVFARGEGRPPLQIGSAKTNFGHMEAAAGMAGLMKAVVTLRTGTIPPHLHFRSPNPHIAWDEYDVEVTATATPLEPTRGARRAGVSSFGFSGTNAHVILEEAPETVARLVRRTTTPNRKVGSAGVDTATAGSDDVAAEERPLHLLTLSAPHDDGLKALAGRYVAYLQDTSASFPDVCFTANTGRTHFDRRIAVVAGSADAAAHALSAWIEGRDATGLFTGRCEARGRATAFVFPADAPDVAILADASPVVRRTLDAWTEEAARRRGDPSSEPGGSAAQTRDDTRPADLKGAAHQHALAALWTACGVRPDVFTATGAGHVPADVAAGHLNLGDAVPRAGDEGPSEPGPTRKTRGDGATGTVDTDSLADHDVGRIVVLGPADRVDVPGSAVVVSTSNGLVGWEAVLSGLARLHVSGADVDGYGLDEGHLRARVPLPGYPFQRRRFWLERWEDTAGSAADEPRMDETTTRSSETEATDPWTRTREAAVDRAGLAPLDLNLSSYPAKWALLGELTREVGRNALANLGVFDETGATAGVDDIVEHHGVDPLYRRIVERWLHALEADGALERTDDGWAASVPLVQVDLAPLWERVDDVMADNPALLAYVRNAADKTEGVLTGRIDALETLFPDGSFDMASELYESATQLRYVNGIAAAALHAFVSARPAGAPMRVLEVGAGTGGTTSSLLPALLADGSRYDYSDVSDSFLDWGRDKFASVPFLRTLRFDLESDPGEQGVEPGSYDVVVGSNVLHAVRDLRSTLERVRSLLSPGGLLLLVESTGHLAWHDITTGLIEGWQHFDDNLRTDTPLLSVDTWHTLLDEAGFSASAAAPQQDSPAAILRQHVILAVAQGRAGATAERDASNGREPPRSPGAPGEHAATPEAAESDATGTSGEAVARRLADAVGTEREEIVTDAVRACVMEVLRSDPTRPPSKDARLMELGLDSLMAVRLRNVLERRLGLDGRLPSTLAFDHPTIRHIAALALRLMADTSDGPRRDAAVAEADESTHLPDASEADDDDRRREVSELSDEEAEARLLERLERDDL